MNNQNERDYYKLLSYNLNRLAENNNMTQREIAEGISAAPASLNLYFLGKRFPNAQSLANLANFFNVPISTFFKTPREAENDAALAEDVSDVQAGTIIGTTLNASAIETAIAKRKRERRTGLFYIVVFSDDFNPYAAAGEQLECTVDENAYPGCVVLAKNGRKTGLYRAVEKAGSLVYTPVTGHSQAEYSEGKGFSVLCNVLAGRRPV
jgi:transcriptional regulator with XRE-family HTH domain